MLTLRREGDDRCCCCLSLGRLAWGADCLLDRRKRLGIWVGRTAFHRLLRQLGKAGDSDRLLQAWTELPPVGLCSPLTPRSLHLLVKGLLLGGQEQADKARQLVAEAQQLHPGLALKDVTKALLEQPQPAAGGAEEDEEKAAGKAAASPPEAS